MRALTRLPELATLQRLVEIEIDNNEDVRDELEAAGEWHEEPVTELTVLLNKLGGY